MIVWPAGREIHKSKQKTKHDREVNIVMGQIPDYDVPNPLLGK